MPRTGITAYDLLISCPGDVLQYAEIVKECVESFNHTLGCINNAEIVTRHWATDSFPQSGDRPQELLNKQFVRDCDAAVAIFWTKFGTPTDKYGSGTEEEIEEMLSSGKQVFLYFVDAPINPSVIDMEQYHKVNDFKEKYKGRGLYGLVKDESDLRKQFANHLTMYFLPIITGEISQDTTTVAPLLQIQDYDSGNEDVVTYQQLALSNCKLMSDKVQAIYTLIDNLKDNYLPQRTPEKQEEASQSLLNDGKNELIKRPELSKMFLNSLTDVNISERWKETILKFCERNNIEIPEQFWYVGNLKQSSIILSTPFSNNSPSLEGNDAEQQRYKSIQKLYWDIVEYNEYLMFFSRIDTQKFVRLVVANTGTTFDEDIDIKLIVKKDCLLTFNDFPIPDINIIDEILEMDFLEFAYELKETDSISKYSDYPVTPVNFDYRIPDPFNRVSASDEYKRQKENYKTQLKHIMCYQKYEKETCDILVFHISYLKHHVKMAFPSVLAFKNLPEEIEYEITSKHVPDVTKGKISLISEKTKYIIKLTFYMYSASSTMILLCRSSQSENSFGLAVFFFTACFRSKASFLKDSKAASISSKRSTGKPGVFFALLILFRQFWHSFL